MEEFYLTCNFTKTPSWVFFRFNLYKWYQIEQNSSYNNRQLIFLVDNLTGFYNSLSPQKTFKEFSREAFMKHVKMFMRHVKMPYQRMEILLPLTKV